MKELCSDFLLPTRTYTGIMKFPTVPPPDVRAWLQHELEAGVPRNMMAKGMFSLQHKIYRYVFRLFGPSSLRLYNEDIVNAQTTILCGAPLPGRDLTLVPHIAECLTNRAGVRVRSFVRSFVSMAPPKLANSQIPKFVEKV